MSTIALIPARAGSKGLPGKNLLTLGDKALWEIAMQHGLDAGCDKVVVSTDIEAILKSIPSDPRVTWHWRLRHLASDSARIEDVLTAVLDAFPGYDHAVVINPTHPFTTPDDIKGCMSWLDGALASPSCMALRMDWSYTAAEAMKLKSLNRQNREARFAVSGAIYAVRVPDFKREGRLVLSEQGRIIEGPHIDIDSEADYICAKVLWEKIHGSTIRT